MKIILTRADLQAAIVAHVAQFNITVSPEQLDIGLDEIEVNLNPDQSDNKSTTATTSTTKRTRRTKAEIEAEELKSRVNPIYETTDPTPATQTTSPKLKEEIQEFMENTSEDTLVASEDFFAEEATPVAVKSNLEPDSIFG